MTLTLSQDTTYLESNVWSDQQIELWRSQLMDALVPEKLEQWLLRHKPYQIVGNANHVRGCVMHHYLEAVLPWLDCVAALNHVYVDVPAWIDGQYGYYDYLCSNQQIYLADTSGHLAGGNARKLPDWFKPYLNAIDDRYMRQTPIYEDWSKGLLPGLLLFKAPWPIPAAGALELLKPYLQKTLEESNA